LNIHLFKIALEHLNPSDWELFEELCSQFLVAEFDKLRTMASPSGDGGRDSEIFSPEGNSFVAAQYSVTEHWKSKIRQTKKTIKETMGEARILLYMSNQQIGGQADELKKELLKDELMLDVRDFNWFLERASTSPIREAAAEALIERVARPYLAGESVIEKRNSPLTSGEARAALVYLGLQWQDDITDKGLTKLSFDALVRAALRHTSSEQRISREKVHQTILSALPSADKNTVIHHVDKALSRLEKKYIRYWKKEDEFCLTHDESQRILDRLAEESSQEAEFLRFVKQYCSAYLDEIAEACPADLGDLSTRVPRILEKLLLRQGESFVAAVKSGNLSMVGTKELADIVISDLNEQRPHSKITHHYPKIVAATTQALLAQSEPSIHTYLRRLSNSYTLLSFLNETPDVQSATRKLFSYGTVWIDTTVLLPLIAEQLEEELAQRRLTQVFSIARSAGIELRVTTGVIQEVDAHMNNALSCCQYHAGTWRGRTPYLYYQFLHTGQSPCEFRKWISIFRGIDRPEDDLAQYFLNVFEIKRQDLAEEVTRVPDNLRWAAERLWTDAHEHRRQRTEQADQTTTRLLIKHDLETYLGVVGLRGAEDVTELGYRHWLLTLDRNAWEIGNRLKFSKDTPPSPLLSLSFFVSTITFGLVRRRVGKDSELRLPLILDIEMAETSLSGIVQLADDVRRENSGLPEFVIRRKVRDAIDRARRKQGSIGYGDILDTDEAEQMAQVDR
jgi:hypothetical protein